MADTTNDNRVTRRGVLATAAVLATGILPSSLRAQQSPATTRAADLRYKISACDWILLKRQKVGAVKLAKDVGCDGVEVDMGGLGDRPTFDSKLLDPAVHQQYLDALATNDITMSSIAMSGFYAQSFAARDSSIKAVSDCVATAQSFGVKTTFLPLGVQNDLVKYPELRPKVVDKLKAVADVAAKAGVVIGIETALDAAGDCQLLEDVGNPAVRVYFNFSNVWQHGRDIHKELNTLGRDRICQIHCTNVDKFWLQDDPQVDMPAIKKTLDAMGWSGWLVIERSRRADRGRDVRGNFTANAAYLKKVFQV